LQTAKLALIEMILLSLTGFDFRNCMSKSM
jgi:hypothetical protein